MYVFKLDKIAGDSEKHYQPSDLKQLTKTYRGIRLYPDKIKKTLGKVKLANSLNISNVSKIHNVDGEIFIVLSNKNVYKYVDGVGYQFAFIVPDRLVELTKIIYNGKQSVFAISPNCNCTAYDGNQSYRNIMLPFFSKVFASFGNSLYLATGNRIVFEKFENLSNMNDGKSPTGNFINLPESAGEIIALISDKKRLLIFCKKSIYELKPLGEEMDFIVSKKFVLSQEIRADSVCRMEEGIAFISGDKACRYINEKIERYDLIKDLSAYSVNAKACCFGENYILPITDSVGNRALYFNFSNLSEGDFCLDDYKITDDGYLAELLGDLYCLSENSGAQELGEWISKPFDFDTANKVAIKGLSITAGDKLDVCVSCDYTTRTFSYNKGTEYKKTNLKSRVFSISARSNYGLEFEKLKIKYAIKGE